MVLVLLVVLVLVLTALLWLGARRTLRLEDELRELRRTARIDPPTALRSRMAFSEDLELELERCARSGRPASLVVLAAAPGEDHDRTFVESELADAIAVALRAVDLGYRIGAEEFALILPDTRAAGGELAIGRLQQELGRRNGSARAIYAGIAEVGPGIDRHVLFRHAYCALLACGRDGRGEILAYSPELERRGGGSGRKQDPLEV